VIFSVAKFGILLKRKESHATWLMELFGKFPENWPHFEELFFEIAKIFGGFGQISSAFFFFFP
jgi:hypothetical protein